MKKYIGKKEIMAEPMNECIAIKKGFARPNTDNHEWRSGYHVQYTNPDGSTYDSWSPKDVFERSYQVADTFLDRLKIEHREVGERFEKYAVFVDSDKFREVLKEDYPAFLLYVQRILMGYYTEILELRMDSAEDKEIPSVPRMSFGIAIEALKFGFNVRRKSWTENWLLTCVLHDDISSRKIELIDTVECTSEKWNASTKDMFADDWEIVLE